MRRRPDLAVVALTTEQIDGPKPEGRIARLDGEASGNVARERRIRQALEREEIFAPPELRAQLTLLVLQLRSRYVPVELRRMDERRGKARIADFHEAADRPLDDEARMREIVDLELQRIGVAIGVRAKADLGRAGAPRILSSCSKPKAEKSRTTAPRTASRPFQLAQR